MLGVAVVGSVVAHAAVFGTFAWTGRGPSGPRVDVDSAFTQLVLADVEPAVRALPPTTPPTAPPTPPPVREPEPEPPPEPREDLMAEVAMEAAARPLPAPVTLRAPSIQAPAEPVASVPVAVPRPAVMPSFAGVSGVKASRIVYILDCSGPMTSSLPWVKDQLLASVAALGDGQTFRVLVCRRKGDAAPVMFWHNGSDGGGSFPAGGIEAVGGVRAWLGGLSPELATDTAAALRAAFALEPDLVFVLTRSIRRSSSAALDLEGVLSDLNRANPDVSGERRSVVRILQFVDEDPTGLLRAIAGAHGDGPGSYRVMTEDRLRDGQ